MPSPESDPPPSPDPGPIPPTSAEPRRRRGRRVRVRPAWLLVVALGLAHGAAAWIGSGGWSELSSDWPLGQHDHPVHFHSLVISARFLRQSGTTAGYDPSFMAGYPKTVLFPQSSTAYDVLGFLGGSSRPAQAFKGFVFAATASLPWLVALAGLAWGLRAEAVAGSVVLVLLYAWTEGGGAGFPLNFAMYGMLAYWLAVPVGLIAVAAASRFLALGGARRWLLAALLAWLTFLLHATSPMVVAAAGLTAYLAAILDGRARGRPMGPRRHLATWAIPVLAVACNAFWWWPGLWYRSMLLPELPAFYHPEPVWRRLLEIVSWAPPIQSVLVALLVPGLIVLARRDRVASAALGGFALAGFGWGYLAGAFRSLDVLQPGRQTYALYAAASLAGGIALAEVLGRLKVGRGRLDLWVLLGLIVVGLRVCGPDLSASVRLRLGLDGGRPFLSSRPSERLRWVVEQVRRELGPGDRILYEEGGEDLPGVPDPYQGGRFSGLLPHLTGVEVLGGPYLKVTLTTNFTQFGGGRLFGREDWGEEHFRRYAEIYRPTAILCWSPRAVAFCRSHPELIEVRGTHALDLPAIDARTGRPARVRSELVFGRIKGFEGATSRGRARVVAEPGRLRVSGAIGDELDGRVVLRYHSVPYLRSTPPIRLEPVRRGDDPVPFIGFRPPPGDLTLELDFPP